MDLMRANNLQLPSPLGKVQGSLIEKKFMSKPHLRNIFGITVLKNSHPDIRLIKREVGSASIHGNKFWNSTALLIDYLRQAPPKKNWRILEVGCGWGISGIYCARYFKSKVTALDADATVFNFLQYHAMLNGVCITTNKTRYEKLTVAMLSEFDMLIGSDICFWDNLSILLFNLIRRADRAGVKRVLITDPGRPPFRNMAKQCAEKFDALYDNWSVPHPYNTSGLVLDLALSN